MAKIALIISLLISIQTFSHIINVGENYSTKLLITAIKNANNGDSIVVHKGLYQEKNIVINKRLFITGKNNPIFDGEGKYEVFTIIHDSVTISNLTIKDVGVSFTEDRAAIRVIRKKNCKILNNILINPFFGIYLEQSKDCIVKGNIITGDAHDEVSAGNGIHLWYCKNITIDSNTVRKLRDGIYLEFVNNSIVKNNYVKDCVRYGLHFMFSNNDDYIRNKFISNGAGVAVMFSKFITMKYNLFSRNWGASSYGILLKEITDCEIEQNIFKKNTIAIYSEGSNRIKINRNDFIDNGWGLKMFANCYDCEILSNNFINNSFEVATNGKESVNLYEGNYWSQNSGYDLNKDGIADIPYRPVKLFSYLTTNFKPTTILMRSLLVDLINFAEKIVPIITPSNLVDNKPKIKRINNDWN